MTSAIIQTQASHEAGRSSPARRYEALLAAMTGAASATAALSAWAGSRGWDERIVARKLEADKRLAPEDVLALLEAPAGAVIGFRKVELLSGERVLSRADNWFMPERLPETVIASLSEGPSPFGALIAPSHPRRQLIGVERLGIERPGGVIDGGLQPELFRITAIVTGLCDGARRPLALVNEVYMGELVL